MRLTPDERTSIIMRLQNASYAEIAQVLHISELQARKLSSRARKQLQHDYTNNEAVRILKPETKYQLYMRKGSLAEQKGKWENAIYYYLKAVALSHTDFTPGNLTLQQAVIRLHIATSHKQLGRWSQSLTILHDIASIFGKERAFYWKGEAYSQISEIYQMMNNYDLALMYYREAFYQFSEGYYYDNSIETSDIIKRRMADVKQALGILELSLNLLEDALADLQSASELYESIHDYAAVGNINQHVINIEAMI
jgi:tetratricopeptide (TPR) repeat protein